MKQGIARHDGVSLALNMGYEVIEIYPSHKACGHCSQPREKDYTVIDAPLGSRPVSLRVPLRTLARVARQGESDRIPSDSLRPHGGGTLMMARVRAPGSIADH